MNNYSIVIVAPEEHRLLLESLLSAATTENWELSVPLGDPISHYATRAWGNQDDYKAIYNLFHAGVDDLTAEYLGVDPDEVKAILKTCTVHFKNEANWSGRAREHYSEVLTLLGLTPYIPPSEPIG